MAKQYINLLTEYKAKLLSVWKQLTIDRVNLFSFFKKQSFLTGYSDPIRKLCMVR